MRNKKFVIRTGSIDILIPFDVATKEMKNEFGVQLFVPGPSDTHFFTREDIRRNKVIILV